MSTNTINDTLQQVWKELQRQQRSTTPSASATLEEGADYDDDDNNNNSSLSNHIQVGWTTDEASQRREVDGSFNVVRPPVDCPPWLCILLPCIKHVPSMKSFATVQPDDAEVLRNGRWIRYDATSLVTGDVIRLEEGDLIPADCIVLLTTDGGDENDDDDDDDEEELLVDLKAVTGHERLKAINRSTTTSRVQRQLYMGGKIVQGRGTAMVTNIGPRSLLGTLIREGRFPPKEPIVLETLMDGGGGRTTTTNNNNDGAVSIQMGSMS
jgi:hypothetical protein